MKTSEKYENVCGAFVHKWYKKFPDKWTDKTKQGPKKRGNGQTDREDGSDIDSGTNIRRAASVPTIKEDVKKATSQTKGKKIMKALKGGSLRVSMRGTPKSRPSVKKAFQDSVVTLAYMKSTPDLTNLENGHAEDGAIVQDTPKLPVQISAVKPNRKITANKPPSRKKLSPNENINTRISAPTLLQTKSETSNLTQTKMKKSAKNSTTPTLTKTKKKNSSKSPIVSLSPLPTQIVSSQTPNVDVHFLDSESQQNKRTPINKSQTPVNAGSGENAKPLTSSGKRKRKNKDDTTPNTKRKKSLKEQDYSTEEIVQSMSFQDETNIQDSPLPYMYDSHAEACKVFECLIHPVQPDRFHKELWEKKPLLVKRHMREYNNAWFSTVELDKILRERNIQFTRNIDVTTYADGQRQTHNPQGRAFPSIVWDYYQNGCSVRLLNPQTYSRNVWKLLSVLQEYFGCCVGANVYLTPPGTQGFAPHYDDIEAFILQLEGRKHWRLYNPRSDGETLPRNSSGNFTDADIGSPILDTVLDPGDLLYFPRGTIHQGRTMEDSHSLHITVSCYQKNTWGDLLQTMLPRALQLAIEEDVTYRQGLPLNYLNYMGIAHADRDSNERSAFIGKLEQLMSRLINHLPVDSAVDQLGKQIMHDSLPPVISEAERMRSVHGVGARWQGTEARVEGTVEIEPDTRIKLIRKGVLRLLTEEDEVRIYHCLGNTRVYHETDPNFFDIPPECALGVEYLIHKYPAYVTVDSLPLSTVEQKIDVATMLYEHGLLVTEEMLEPIDGED
ncbi:hypothetical protein FSP39_004927 [Pinctada imbricata]|uniref:Bifunctional lysine-specific demethylase and histidyl-hydroxylase n=1 Tax=Pinctada imbricata TaxID=66713 RepID=A0AA88XUD1_PINIB|nr:hypothetical protein FSP39_004927 [Pinctada imbricata]